MESDIPDRDLLAALDSHRDSHAPTVDAIICDIGNDREGLGIEVVIWVFIIVGLDHNPDTNIIQGDVVVIDVVHITSPPRGGFYPDSSS